MSWTRGSVIVGVGVLALAGAAVVGQEIGAPPHHATPSPPARTVTMDASWAEHFESVPALRRAADVAVTGRFDRVTDQTGGPENVMARDYAFVVSRVMYAKAGLGLSGRTVISIHQTGGIAGGVKQEIRDDPLFEVGETAALFLHQDSPGRYHVIGGPGGRFSVDVAGNITPFNTGAVPFHGTVGDLTVQLLDR